jgi:general secretion pathway protein G
MKPNLDSDTLVIVIIVILLAIAGIAIFEVGRIIWGFWRRQGDQPHCRRCDYLLIGIQSERCPECGTPLSPDNILHGERRRPTALEVSALIVFLLLSVSVLVAFAIPESGGRVSDGPIPFVQADLSNLQVALMAFQIDNGRYPTTAEGLNVLAQPPNGLHPYVEKAPVDWWGNPYFYRCPGSTGKPYDLFSCGPDGIPGTADDIK